MTAAAYLGSDVVQPGRPQASSVARAPVGASWAARELKSIQNASMRLSR